MISTFDLVLLVVAFGVLAWGFERYRRSFVRTDLLISAVLASGVVLLAVFPTVFDWVATFLEIGNRFVIISFLVNLCLLALLFYFVGRVRTVRADVSKLTTGANAMVRGGTRIDGDAETDEGVSAGHSMVVHERRIVDSGIMLGAKTPSRDYAGGATPTERGGSHVF